MCAVVRCVQYRYICAAVRCAQYMCAAVWCVQRSCVQLCDACNIDTCVQLCDARNIDTFVQLCDVCNIDTCVHGCAMCAAQLCDCCVQCSSLFRRPFPVMFQFTNCQSDEVCHMEDGKAVCVVITSHAPSIDGTYVTPRAWSGLTVDKRVNSCLRTDRATQSSSSSRQNYVLTRAYTMVWEDYLNIRNTRCELVTARLSLHNQSYLFPCRTSTREEGGGTHTFLSAMYFFLVYSFLYLLCNNNPPRLIT